MRPGPLLTIMLSLAAGTAFAQDADASADINEVVVTAARSNAFGETPGVFVTRRADNLLMTITVANDTRDPARRSDEMRQTLRGLIRGQRPPSIVLSVGPGRVGEFDEAAIDDVIGSGSRPDTSVAQLVVKTRVGPSDTVDDAVRRIRSYVQSSPKVGRAEITVSDRIDLSLVDLARSRPQIIAAIATDAKAVAAALGEGYGVEITGLEQPVDWRQSGPLEARLFIPYELSVGPIEQ